MCGWVFGFWEGVGLVEIGRAVAERNVLAIKLYVIAFLRERLQRLPRTCPMCLYYFIEWMFFNV